MAINSTIHKVDLHISNMDNHYYEQHSLTLAKHSSETDERLMIRLIAFALYAHERLVFGKGIGNQDEPALWIKDLTGEIERWIEVGLIDENRVRKACGRSKYVTLILYGSNADRWWGRNEKNFKNKKNLTVISLPYKDTQAMAAMVTRQMDLTCTIEDGQILLMSESKSVSLDVKFLQ